MSNFYFFIVLCFGCTNLSFAQTSQEDYSYITETLKIQLENNLGDKDGYFTDHFKMIYKGERTIDLHCIHRIVDGKEKIVAYAGIYEKQGNKKQYLCIPHPGSDERMRVQFWNDVTRGHSWSNCEDKIKILFTALSHCDWIGVH